MSKDINTISIFVFIKKFPTENSARKFLKKSATKYF